MNCWCCVVIAFSLPLIAGHENDLLHFSRNIAGLSVCIENRLPDSFKQQIDPALTKLHVDATANKLSGKIVKRKDILKVIAENEINSTNGIELRSEVEKAITECSIIEGYPNSNETNPKRVRVPIFDNEPLGLARILNYVLVNWTEPLDQMIRTRNGRALLRRYANNIQSELYCALTSFERPEYFRIALRVLWLHRAQLLFDGRSVSIPYINHQYTIDSEEPFLAQGYLHLFHNRNPQSFVNRNPRIPQAYLDEFLRIHVRDRARYSGELDIYARYNRGISSAEYYFERLMDQFYRVLFFIHELSVRGVMSDETDTYDGPIPNEVMSNRLQSIIYKNNRYCEYLLRRRNIEITVGEIQNQNLQNLARTSRVCEEFLVLSWMGTVHEESVNSYTVSSTVTPSNFSTSTTLPPPQNKPSKKEKNLLNQPGRHASRFYKNGIEKLDKNKYSNRGKDSCFEKHYNYFLTDTTEDVFNLNFTYSASEKQRKMIKKDYYIFPSFEPNQLQKSVEEASYLEKTIQFILDETDLSVSFQHPLIYFY